MKEKTGRPISFRPYKRVRERLELAQAAGFDMAEVINFTLLKEMDKYLKINLETQSDSMKALRDALNAPDP